jgi:DNA-directed RNA polymerase specialized sigma24 family protein
VFSDWLLTWARHITIRSAIETQRNRIRQVSDRYDRITAVPSQHEPLIEETFEMVVRRSDVLVGRLDVVSRTALVICGIQKNSVADAALMLGISRAAASAAYSAALDCLEEIRFEHIGHESGGAVKGN